MKGTELEAQVKPEMGNKINKVKLYALDDLSGSFMKITK